MEAVFQLFHRPYQGIGGVTPEKPGQRFKKYVGYTIREHLGGKVLSFEARCLAAA